MKQLSQAWEEFLALPKKNKVSVGLFLFFLFIFGFFVTVFYWRIKSPRKTAPLTQAPTTQKQPNLATLSLVPQEQTVKAGQTFLVTINFKTGDYKVDTVDAVLNFDPEILTVEEISEGMFFADYPIKKSESGRVILTGTIGAEDKQKGGAKGEGAMGTIKFRTLVAGSARVNFDNNSLVVVQGENVLGETKGAVFEIY